MKTAIGIVLAVVALVVPTADADVSNARYYANQTPYGDPADSPIASPPPGYTVDSLQTVARHGARSMTSTDAEVRALALWEKARQQGRLTTVGRRFATDLKAFQAAERRIGYGNLSGVGRAEWQGIGRRTAATYPTLFTAAAASGDDLLFKTTTVRRTQDSAAMLRRALETAQPGLDTDSTTVDGRLLIESGSTTRGRAAIAEGLRRPHAVAKARHLLGRLYQADFVARIADPVQAAMDVYLLYCTAPGMAEETGITFWAYVPLEDAPAMAQLKDTQNFYRYGPGIPGERGSFEQADPILADFFTRIDTRLAGGSVAAVFRLAHGETTMPFAARLRLPGSQEQALAFTYPSNPWRGWVAGRLAGNIEWAVYTAAGRPALVTMRYNEQPVAFDASCRPTTPMFYTVAELKRCLR